MFRFFLLCYSCNFSTQVCLTKGSCLIWWKLVTEELYKIYVFFGGIPFSIVELTLLFEILSGCFAWLD
ncbi:hypothetical protein Hdeb2414_s0008g00274441 [Helianthus debilis subsp. tardiflorus]